MLLEYTKKYCIFSNNSPGQLFSLIASKVGDYLREGKYFKYCSLEVIQQIFCFLIPLNQKIITSNKLNLGFLHVPNLVP